MKSDWALKIGCHGRGAQRSSPQRPANSYIKWEEIMLRLNKLFERYRVSYSGIARFGVFCIVLSLPSAVLGAAVCPDPIKIGVTTPLTGGIALQGSQVRNAVETAVNEINATGGIGGKKIQLLVEDTAGTVSVAISALNRILQQDPVLVFGSMISPENFAQSDIIRKEQLPYIYGGTNSQLSEQGIPWMFRISFHDGQEAQILPRYIAQKHLKPAILAVADDFGLGAVKNFQAEFKKLNIPVVAVETYSTTDRDMSAQLLKIKDSGANAIILWGRTPDLIVILRSKARLGIQLPVLSTTGAAAPATLINLADNEADGILVFGGALPNGSADPKIITWFKKLNDTYHFPPDNWALAYYDAMNLVETVIKRVGCDKEAIRKELATTKDFQGLLTKYSADQKGNLTNVNVIYQLKGKTPELQEIVDVK
jgi:branched-chain amino acid transport system substrate-binding protein